MRRRRSEALGATEIHPSGAPGCAVLDAQRRHDDRQSRTDITLVQQLGQNKLSCNSDQHLPSTPKYLLEDGTNATFGGRSGPASRGPLVFLG